LADIANKPESISNEFIRRIFLPGISAIVTVWLVQSGVGLLNFTTTFAGQSVFIRLVFLHWDMKLAFAVASLVWAVYGELVSSSAKQRYLSAVFPGFFEIVKCAWMLRFPLPSWIDPARQVYRFFTLSIAANLNFWLVHIVIPSVIAVVVVALLNRRLHFRLVPNVEMGRS